MTQHRAGSRKGKVHATFNKSGRDKAIAHGRKLGLKDSTLKNWCCRWNREKNGGTKKKVVAKKVTTKAAPAKKVVKKAPVKKTAKKVTKRAA